MSHDDPTRRSVRLEATIRPPAGLAGGDLTDRIVAALHAGDIGIDTSTLTELGDADPAGAP
jgi:hypothetical protein